MRGSKRKAYAGVCVCLLLGVLAAQPAQDTVAVQVEHNAVTITLRITESTDLGAVLTVLCDVTRARCDIDPSAAEVKMPPLMLSGSWAQILSSLFEGSGLNYATTSPVPGHSARLLVHARRPGQDTPVSVPSRAASGSGRTDEDDTVADSAVSPHLPEPAPRDEGGEESTGAGTKASDRQYGGQTGGGEPDPEMMRKSIESVRSLYEGMSMPRAPLPPGSPYVLPWPDANGNPISVPASYPPTMVLPWPDANGNPIVVTPVPGQKTEYPIPPTP